MSQALKTLEGAEHTCAAGGPRFPRQLAATPDHPHRDLAARAAHIGLDTGGGAASRSCARGNGGGC
eukprot:scaffold308503_cov15-Tisochrysis_lutea.AAC.2